MVMSGGWFIIAIPTLPEIRPIVEAYVWQYPQNIWPNMENHSFIFQVKRLGMGVRAISHDVTVLLQD